MSMPALGKRMKKNDNETVFILFYFILFYLYFIFHFPHLKIVHRDRKVDLFTCEELKQEIKNLYDNVNLAVREKIVC